MIQSGNSKLAEAEAPVHGITGWSRKRHEEIHVVDTTMRVTTPENISFQYEISGPFHRLLAYLFDVLISIGGYAVGVIFMSIIFNVGIIPFMAWIGLGGLGQAIEGILAGMIAVGYFVVYWFYGAYTETYFNGQTLGKRITGMRVISTDGHAIDGVQATLRNFFRLLDIMPMVSLAALLNIETLAPGETPDDVLEALGMAVMFPTCLFGLIVMMLNKNFQRVGDMVAGTVVINESRKRKPELAKFLDDRVPQLAELIPTSYVVPPSMARVIAEYVEQRKYLPYQRVSEIASYLAGPLIEKFGIGADTDHDLFLCALYYKTFVSSQGNEQTEMTMMIPNSSQQVFLPPAAVATPVEVMAKRDGTSLLSNEMPDGGERIQAGQTPTAKPKNGGFVLDESDFEMED
ncbi:MAG: RDD family protein [Mariniblastus sp.]